MGTVNIRSLALGNISTKQSRKYLGDPTDPHFIPKSPLIDRQKFSVQEEDELSRFCTFALENVPHSDGDLDDPFRYLASQIIVRQEEPSNQKETRKESSSGSTNTFNMKASLSHGAETATPSETSKRETLQTDVTTPMTTPGVTPGETGKRFSDVGKRPVTAQPSNWRPGSKSAKPNMIYSFLNEPLPTRPSFSTAASKSMTNLPTLNKDRSKQQKSNPMQNPESSVIGKPDFNKSLPAIPRFVTEQNESSAQPKEKSRGITRMLKTVRLHKTQTAPVVAARSTSTEFTTRQREVLERPASKKHKFNPFTFLQKRTSINTKRATVG